MLKSLITYRPNHDNLQSKSTGQGSEQVRVGAQDAQRSATPHKEDGDSHR